MEGRMEGSRPRGHPKAQWLYNVKAWMGMDVWKIGDLTPDRGDFINALRSVRSLTAATL